MTRIALFLFLFVFCLLPFQGLITAPALAITAEEQLADQDLELRARGLSKQLRCLVCQNQSIDDSDADLAKDLRAEVRAQILAGADDKTILANLQERYGDYVLLKPPVGLSTTLLWATPILALIIGAGLILLGRRRKNTPDPAPDRPERPSNIEEAKSEAQSPPAFSLPIFIGIGGICVAVAASLYWFVLGKPQLPAQPLSTRTAEISQTAGAAQKQLQERQEAYETARENSQKQPENIGAWLSLALASAEVGKTAEELDALRTALRLSKGDIAIKSMLAEALARSADGQVIPEARQLVAETLKENPREPRALFLSGLALMEDGNYQGALDRWGYLVEISPIDAPWLAMVRANMRQAAEKAGIEPDNLPVLSEQTLAEAAQMSAEDRAQMIESMVEQLSQRLQENPQDVPGWQRLARAYEVLEQPEQALEAWLRASEAGANDLRLQIGVLERLMAAGQDKTRAEQIAEQAQAALARARAIQKDNPEILFFAGHFARLAGDIQTARQSWQSLLDRLPPTSETARLLQAELDKLAP